MSHLLMKYDARRIPLGDASVHCVVTSPPYFGLRDYGDKRQIGLEPTPGEYVAAMVGVFRELHRVLRGDGVVFLNLGDSYSSGGNGVGSGKQTTNLGSHLPSKKAPPGFKSKDRLGIPHRVVFALQEAGWYWRDEIIWCLSGGAWIYAKTQKGEMPVMVKDLVRLDPSTVKLWNGEKWTQVLGWNRSPEPSVRLEIVLRSGERIGCTGNHEWPTRRGNVMASDLRVGDTIMSCHLPEPNDARQPDYLTDAALWFVGLYLAEGSMADDTIQIAGHMDEMHRVPMIEALARHYGGTATHTVSGNKLNIRVYSRVLRAILETYIGGCDAYDKHLKVAAWSLPNLALRRIVEGYLEGDGHPDGNRVRLGFCRNYSLERDLRTAAARLGATLTLSPAIATNQTGKFPSFKGEWRWDRSGHWNEKDRGEILEIRQSRARTFWDIGVEDEPHLFALASGLLTHNSKRNPMPESVTDRTTKSHEMVFVLAKSERYFWDHVAIQEPAAPASKDRYKYKFGGSKQESLVEANRDGVGNRTCVVGEREAAEDRNARSVWDIPTVSFPGAHFATMPPRLAERCILAGTSEKGCCSKCGEPYERLIESEREATRPGEKTKTKGKAALEMRNRDPERHVTSHKTVGWYPGCKCPVHAVLPCVVFDPFNGSGTTGSVATGLNRRYVGGDLNDDYLTMARRRIERPHARTVRAKKDESLPLFGE